MKLFSDFIQCEKGATAIEYGLIAALISVAAIVGIRSTGNSISTRFSTIAVTVSR
ncbi:MAG: Flp family type IVb pilin [Rickettsiales bacterium]|nr:Flp family type IVb pilin [Rickettsiales bacterium]